MRRFLRGSFAAFLFALAGCGGSGSSGGAPGDPTIDPDYVNPPVHATVTGYADHIMEPFLSRDGRFLLFNNRNDPPDACDLHVAERVDDLTFTYLGPLAGANSARLDAVPSLDAAGRLLFVSLRSYDTTLVSVFAGTFSAAAVTVTGIGPIAGISRGIAGYVNFDAEVGASGDRLYYVDGHFAGGPVPDVADILVAARAGSDFTPLANAADIMRNVNSAELEYAPALTADELELFFTRLGTAPGAEPRLFRAVRASVTDPFGPPLRIAAATGFVEAATVAPGGRAIYYHALEAGRFVLMRMAR